MQRTSSIHTLIHHILESHELNDQNHPKMTEITFSFPKFAPASKKNQLISSAHS